MKAKLRCKICGGQHKPTTKNFPVALYERREAFEGKGKNRKSLGIQPVLVGYACKKCVRKYELAQFIKEHHIRPKYGQSLKDAVREKIDALKAKKNLRIAVPKIKPEKEKPRLWQRIKERFQGRKGGK